MSPGLPGLVMLGWNPGAPPPMLGKDFLPDWTQGC